MFLILQGQVYSQQSVLAEQVALSFTYGPGAFDEEGNFKNANVSRKIFALLANTLAPDTLPKEVVRDLLDKN